MSKLRLLKNLFGNENGMALVMALGILVVLSITGTSIAYYSTTNARSSNYAKGGQNAYALAEAGVNDALSVLASSFQPATPTALPTCPVWSTTKVLEGGSYQYCGTLTGTTWTVQGKGWLRNSAAPGSNVQRIVKRSVSIWGLNTGSSISAWSRIYQDDAANCLDVPDGVTITGNVGAKGNLCLDGGEILGSSSMVAVGGNVVMTAGGSNTSKLPAGTGAGWTNPGNIVASDNAKATALTATNTVTPNLDATNFGFALPADAAILGVSLKVERGASATNSFKDNSIKLLKAGAPTGTDKVAGAPAFWVTADTNVTYGAANDLWGTTLTPADVNASNFGVRFIAKNSNAGQQTANVDYVELTITYTNGLGIGTPTTSVQEADVAGTCKYLANATHSPCSAADHVYAGTYTTAPTGLQKPTVDFAYWYNNAAPGPKHGCDVSSGTPPVFDSNGTYDGGNADQWPSPDPGAKDNPAATNGGTTGGNTSYTCQAKDAQGNIIGELSWNNATRVLTCKGTIFFDGAAIWHNHNGYVAHYQGRCTIYAAGGWHNDEALCAGGSGLTTCRDPATISNWNPAQNMMVLILGDKNTSGADDCNFHTDYSAFQGVIWSKNHCAIKDTAYMSGPVLSNDVDITGTPTFFAWPPLGTLLAGQIYGSTSTSTDFLIQPGQASG